MRFGRVLTYKDLDEAKKLVGKKVVASDFYASICDDDTACDCMYDTLKAVHADKVCPFECDAIYSTQFIREILLDKPEYEPYDLSDPAVRDSLREYKPYNLDDAEVRKSLRGRWIIYTKGDEYTTEEVIIVGFGKQGKDYWKVITGTGEIDATELLEYYIFDDGTPCGRKVE